LVVSPHPAEINAAFQKVYAQNSGAGTTRDVYAVRIVEDEALHTLVLVCADEAKTAELQAQSPVWVGPVADELQDPLLTELLAEPVGHGGLAAWTLLLDLHDRLNHLAST